MRRCGRNLFSFSEHVISFLFCITHRVILEIHLLQDRLCSFQCFCGAQGNSLLRIALWIPSSDIHLGFFIVPRYQIDFQSVASGSLCQCCDMLQLFEFDFWVILEIHLLQDRLCSFQCFCGAQGNSLLRIALWIPSSDIHLGFFIVPRYQIDFQSVASGSLCQCCDMLQLFEFDF
nr:hypothetical protein MZNIZDYX_MZNIZDYX_CDS_0053 [uncultured phage]